MIINVIFIMDTNEMEKKKNDPWWKEVEELALKCLGNSVPVDLHTALLKLLQKASVEADRCIQLRQVKRSEKLYEIMTSFFLHFHVKNSALKKLLSSPCYEDLLSAMLSLTVDLQLFLASQDNVRWHQNNAIRDVLLYLGNTSEYIWDVIIQSVLLRQKNPKIVYPVIRRLMEAGPREVNDPKQFMKFLLAGHFWMKSTGLPDHKQYVKSFMLMLSPPTAFLDWYNRLNIKGLPKKTSSKKITKLFLKKLPRSTLVKICDMLSEDIEAPDDINLPEEEESEKTKDQLFFIDTKGEGEKAEFYGKEHLEDNVDTLIASLDDKLFQEPDESKKMEVESNYTEAEELPINDKHCSQRKEKLPNADKRLHCKKKQNPRKRKSVNGDERSKKMRKVQEADKEKLPKRNKKSLSKHRQYNHVEEKPLQEDRNVSNVVKKMSLNKNSGKLKSSVSKSEWSINNDEKSDQDEYIKKDELKNTPGKDGKFSYCTKKSPSQDGKLGYSIEKSSNNDGKIDHSTKKSPSQNGKLGYSIEKSSNNDGKLGYSTEKSPSQNVKVGYSTEKSPSQDGKLGYSTEKSPSQNGKLGYSTEKSPSQNGKLGYSTEKSPSQNGKLGYSTEKSSSQDGKLGYSIEKSPTQDGKLGYSIEKSPSQDGKLGYSTQKSPSQDGKLGYSTQKSPSKDEKCSYSIEKSPSKVKRNLSFSTEKSPSKDEKRSYGAKESSSDDEKLDYSTEKYLRKGDGKLSFSTIKSPSKDGKLNYSPRKSPSKYGKLNGSIEQSPNKHNYRKQNILNTTPSKDQKMNCSEEKLQDNNEEGNHYDVLKSPNKSSYEEKKSVEKKKIVHGEENLFGSIDKEANEDFSDNHHSVDVEDSVNKERIKISTINDVQLVNSSHTTQSSSKLQTSTLRRSARVRTQSNTNCDLESTEKEACLKSDDALKNIFVLTDNEEELASFESLAEEDISVLKTRTPTHDINEQMSNNLAREPVVLLSPTVLGSHSKGDASLTGSSQSETEQHSFISEPVISHSLDPVVPEKELVSDSEDSESFDVTNLDFTVHLRTRRLLESGDETSKDSAIVCDDGFKDDESSKQQPVSNTDISSVSSPSHGYGLRTPRSKLVNPIRKRYLEDIDECSKENPSPSPKLSPTKSRSLILEDTTENSHPSVLLQLDTSEMPSEIYNVSPSKSFSPSTKVSKRKCLNILKGSDIENSKEPGVSSNMGEVRSPNVQLRNISVTDTSFSGRKEKPSCSPSQKHIAASNVPSSSNSPRRREYNLRSRRKSSATPNKTS
ncbi:uncharacterized protein LOC106462733 isoform X2 [Limulus polyphemus]|uniref:Uncharacterized protein LOC106462733 isoform X2 n=1 Tax=Limulus polyphemus TaxID=6850 RepID=A0ABM1BAJ1_LIMPO|nr:uncharacterized protein LOC106462733 isoform X2 [Limulus polyphemus]